MMMTFNSDDAKARAFEVHEYPDDDSDAECGRQRGRKGDGGRGQGAYVSEDNAGKSSLRSLCSC